MFLRKFQVCTKDWNVLAAPGDASGEARGAESLCNGYFYFYLDGFEAKSINKESNAIFILSKIYKAFSQ